tara:strand:+ start:475 stop:1485 length:1011 start_codon:yes stop_codon:yes gene_type:complete
MTNNAIAIDAMGGDFGPEVTVPSANKFATLHPDCKILLYGDRKKITPFINESLTNITVIHCACEVQMGEKISSVFRRFKSTSMGQSIHAQHDGEVTATVSAGNTGALMAIAYKVLKTLPGVLRPAIISGYPTKTAKEVFMLDLGANINCSVENLIQFALMGEFVAKSKGIAEPRIGLLNIGEEQNKGNHLIKASFSAFKQLPINFIGYIEPNQIYSDKVDVVVCDGFTGNIMLKSCQGTAKFLKLIYQEALTSSWFGKLCGFLLKNTIKSKLKQYDPKFRNGAMLIGLNGIVVKSHGSACMDGFYNAISLAHELSSANPHSQLQASLKQNETIYEH